MEMEHTAAAWGPFEFEVANWAVDEGEGADIFGTCCSFQAPMPASFVGVEGQQLAELYYDGATGEARAESRGVASPLLHHRAEELSGASAKGDGTSSLNQTKNIIETVNKKHGTVDDDVPTAGNTNTSSFSGVFKQVASEFKDDINLMKHKMHRYPASLRHLDETLRVPRFVAIGPYHHDQPHLKQAEKVKHMAVVCCVNQCGGRLQEMYDAVAAVAVVARRLYDNQDARVRGINEVDFRDMMFVDACFLVQYMLMVGGGKNTVIDPSLNASLKPNRSDILHDMMLLENQLPWMVVETVEGFFPWKGSLPTFVSSLRGCLQDHKNRGVKDKAHDQGLEDYKPPHLLGLLRYYIVGREEASCALQIEDVQSDQTKGDRKPKNRSVSQSAVELEKIGIKLIPAKETAGLTAGMALDVEAGILHAELSLPPVSLNLDRASYLVNMAALELCTVQSFAAARDEDSAVCSYLLLLAMLAYREEDVHELRERGLLQGGGGLTNEDTLCFFTRLQFLRLGRRYLHVMKQIDKYTENRTKVTKLNMCWYDKKKTIAAVVGGVVSLATIVGTLVSIKTAI